MSATTTRLTALLAAVALVVSMPAAAAWAIEPPVVAEGPPPGDPEPAPDRPMRQVSDCVQTLALPGSDFREMPAGSQMMDMPAAWKESTGVGVVVGIIDTGVAAQPRLPHLMPGGDYVMGRGGDGLSDCDGHGTVVASLIGASPAGAPLPPKPAGALPPPEPPAPESSPPAAAGPAGPEPSVTPPPAPTTTSSSTAPAPVPPQRLESAAANAPAWGPAPQAPVIDKPLAPPVQEGLDALVGIAPDATLISIRQSAQTFGFAEPLAGENPQEIRRAGDINTLARSVVHMANLGAKVINISVMSCVPVGKPLDQTALGEAVRYAAVERDAVIITAAGNAGSEGCTGQNPDPFVGGPDPLGWDSVKTIATPAWFTDYVLAVSATDSFGVPLTGQSASLHGPWVGLAAPGTEIVGLSTSGELINASIDQDKVRPIAGSSFAAAYVSGTAALVRAKFPNLSAHQVIHRLQATAHPPPSGRDTVIGYGVVDPVAALTWDVEPGELLPPAAHKPLHVEPAPPAPDARPRVGAAVAAALAVVLIGLTSWAMTVKRRRGRL